MKHLLVLAVIALVLSLTACAKNPRDWSKQERVDICQATMTLVMPECERLNGVADGRYTGLCKRIVLDASTACAAGILKEPELICNQIVSHTMDCSLLGDDSPEKAANVSTCRSIVQAVALVCTLSTLE